MKLLKIFAFIFLLSIPIGPSCAKEPAYKLFELDGGIKVLVKTIKASPIVSAGIWVRVGSINETQGEEGYSRLIEKMAYTGTTLYPKDKALSEIAKIGAQKSGFAGSDYTCYSILGPASSLDKLLEIQFDAVFNLDLNKKKLTEKSKLLIGEIERNFARTDLRIEEELLRAAFNGRYYGTPSAKALSNLKFIDLKNIECFYQRYYTADNVCIVIAGSVDAENALAAVKRFVHMVPKTYNYAFVSFNAPKHKRAITRVVYDNVQKSYIRMGYLTPDGKSPDRFALTAAAKMLGGKNGMLQKELIEELKLGFSADAAYYSSRFPMLFEVGGVTTPGLADRFIKNARQVIKRLKTGDFSGEALEMAKQQIIAEEIFASESAEKRAANYAHCLMLENLGDIDDFTERVFSLTPLDIQSAAEKYFNESELTIARLEPLPTPDDAMPQMLGLENKAKLIVKCCHSSPSVAVSIKVMAGGLQEANGQGGLAKAAAALLFNNKKINAAENAAMMGTKLSYEVNKSYASFNMQCLSEHFSESFNLLMSCLLEPDFSQNAFEEVKEALLREAAAETNIECKSLSRCVKNEAIGALFADTQLSYPSCGLAKDIKALSVVDVKNFYRKYYVGANIAAAISGDIYIEENKNKIIGEFLKFKTGKAEIPDSFKLKKNSGPIEVKLKTNLASGCTAYVGRTAPRASAHTAAINLIYMILAEIPSSRLSVLSQKMPFAEFKAEHKSMLNEGYFCVSVSAPAAALSSASRALKEELELIKQKGIENDEFETAKKYALGSYALTLRDNASLADNFSKNEIMGLGFDWFKTYPEQLKAITKEQAQNAAKEYLPTGDGCVEATAQP